MCLSGYLLVARKFVVDDLDARTSRCCLLAHRTACDLNSAQGLSWGHIELGKTLLIVRILLLIERGVSLPAAGLVDGRGVVSRSPTLDDCRGGELIIMPSLANCEGGAGVDRTGDD